MWFESPISYETPIYRPPSEAQSLLLQLTIGCSHNRCTFCAMYRKKTFRVKSLSEIEQDIASAQAFYAKYHNSPRKIFLCDGDALAAPADLLQEVLERLKAAFPAVRRIGIYATARNILEKSEKELRYFAQRGLSIAYIGIESGSDEVLRRILKGNTSAEMIEACERLKDCGWKRSVIIMLGLGGRELSSEHCKETSRVISAIGPEFFSFLTTVPVPGTPYYRNLEQGRISLLSSKELLQEMRSIISEIRPEGARIIFRSNHVSNQLPLEGVLPKDSTRLISELETWIAKCPEGEYLDHDPSFL